MNRRAVPGTGRFVRPLRASALLAVLAAAALAGCSDPKSPGPTGEDGLPADDAAPDPLALPTWSVGDWWLYGVEAGGGEESVTRYIVTADLGADWRTDTDSPERAFQDARSDISRLGPQRKADLAGSQGADRVQFFQWPLQANATWATRWDAQDVTIQVLATGPDGATLTARNATQAVYTYTYDAAAGWFGRLDRHGPDGSVAFSLVLLDNGHGWTGSAVRYELVPLFERDVADVSSVVVDVPAGATDLWLAYEAHCTGGAGGYTLDVHPVTPDPAVGHRVSEQCTDRSFAGTIADQPPAGQWQVTYVAGGQPATTQFSVTLLQRTLVEVPVG